MQARLNRLLYFSAQRFRKEPVKSAYLDLKRSSNYSREQLEELQNKRLHSLVNHAVDTVPFYKSFYREWIDEIKSSSSTNIKDIIVKLPALQKSKIIENRGLFYSNLKYNAHSNISSGTTGEPFAYPCDQISWAYRHASLIRLLELHGVSFGSRYGYFFGQHWKQELKLKTTLKDWFFNRDRFSAFDSSIEAIQSNHQKFLDNRVSYFLGYPSTMVEYCKVAQHQLGLDLKKLALKLVITTGETLEPFQREYLSTSLGCRVVNYYGSAEGGFASFEGLEGEMHENMETCYLEFDENKRVLKTDLILRQFPLIKIQTNDVCEPVLSNKRTELNHRVIGSLSGRTGEKIKLPSGKKVHSVVLDYFFDLFINHPNILKFRFEFFNHEVVLLLKVRNNVMDEKLGTSLKSEFDKLFSNTPFRILKVNDIELLPNGKNRPWIQR